MADGTPVSWIDPDEVADLVRQLQGPAQKPQPGAWELHTLPMEAMPSGPAFSLAPDDDMVPSLAPEEESNQDGIALPVDEPSEEMGPVDGFAPVEATPVDVSPAGVDPFEEAMEESGAAEIDRIRHQLRLLRQQAQAAGVIAAPPTPTAPPVAEVEAPATEVVEMAQVFACDKPEPEVAQAPASGETTFPPLQLPEAGLGDRLQAVCSWAIACTGSDEVVLIDEFGDVLCGHSEQISLVLSALMAWQSGLRNDPMQALSAASSVERPMPDGRRIVFVPVRSQYGVVNLAMVRKAPLPEQMAATLAHALLGAIDPVA